MKFQPAKKKHIICSLRPLIAFLFSWFVSSGNQLFQNNTLVKPDFELHERSTQGWAHHLTRAINAGMGTSSHSPTARRKKGHGIMN